MRLYEYEAKELLKKYEIKVPEGNVQECLGEPGTPLIVKAQVLFGKRAELGGIIKCQNHEEAEKAIKELTGKKIKGEEIKKVLVEALLKVDKEYFISFSFDTESRGPVLLFSSSGGTGIEEREVKKLIINELTGITEEQAAEFLGEEKELAEVIVKLWEVFKKGDCKLLELNPLVKTEEGFVCLDAHIELDDFAKKKHKEREYEKRPSNLGRELTERERKVKEASEADYHGTVKYIEMDGDIAFLAAGGGGSLTCMDALIDAGGKPSNYTEFSGDPTEEKMYVLTKEAVTKPGIQGCWIVGAIANFTRVDVMARGVIKALEEVKPEFPIVIRRAGPGSEEGLQMLRDAAEKNKWDMEIFNEETPLTETAKIIVGKINGNTA